MWRSASLGRRLLVVMVIGAVLLAAALSTVTAVALLSGRDQALDTVAKGLEEQGKVDLNLLIARDVTLSAERITSAQNIGQIAAQAVGNSTNGPLIDPDVVDRYTLVERPDGTLADVRQGIVLPTGVTRSAALEDLRESAVLDVLLPAQSQFARDITLISYIGPSGVVRIFPARNSINSDGERQRSYLDLVGSGTRQVWTEPHKTPQSSGLTWTVITPIYNQGTFYGLIAVDVVLSQVTFDIGEQQPTEDSFSFLIDSERSLIAAPAQALPLLTGDPNASTTINLQDKPHPLTSVPNQQLDAALVKMAAQERFVERLDIDGAPYLLAYAPIEGTDWRLGMFTPIDELTAKAAEGSDAIVNTSTNAILSILGIAALSVILLGLAAVFVGRLMVRPLGELAQAAQAVGAGDYQQQVQVKSDDEIGRVAAAFNIMGQSLQRAYAELEAKNQALELTVQARTVELENTVAELEQTLMRQARMNEMMRALSTPVLPVLPDVLLMPIIGELTADRAQQVLHDLLMQAEGSGARLVILDVTGLSVIDTHVAQTLLRAAQSLKLLGARAILVGLRPEVAQTIVSLGLTLADIRPVRDLQTALTMALRDAAPATAAAGRRQSSTN